jgi:hypothetical protein
VARAPASSSGGSAEDGVEHAAATQAKRRGLRVLCDSSAAANGASSGEMCRPPLLRRRVCVCVCV